MSILLTDYQRRVTLSSIGKTPSHHHFGSAALDKIKTVP